MNILGINGSIGWDGNIGFLCGQDYWCHGSGATLFIDGELAGSLSEERLTRLKHDGGYPENVIKQLLLRNNLTPADIDMVGYVGNAVLLCYALKLQGYTNKALSEKFPNAKIMFVDHHLAHAAGSFLSSGFTEANIFSFDGAGDFHPGGKANEAKLNNSVFYDADLGAKRITPLQQTFLDDANNMFGTVYTILSTCVYELKTMGKRLPSSKVNWEHSFEAFDTNVSTEELTDRLKAVLNVCSFSREIDMTDFDYRFEDNMYMAPIVREQHPGKIMGLSSYGDYKNIDSPDLFVLTELDDMPVIWCDEDIKNNLLERSKNYQPEDLASWLQHQFEKYLLLYLKNIPKKVKSKNLCLSGGCALNILSNSKIIEEGIYEDVHVNTAPNDDGLNFGVACLLAFKNEKEFILPENIGCIGFEYENYDVLLTLKEKETHGLCSAGY